MMDLTNFKVEDTFSSIEVDGSHHDLHNNFSFIGLEYDALSHNLYIILRLRDEGWVASHDPTQLKIIFSSVRLFKAKERDADCSYSEDDRLSTIGFIGNDMPQEIEGGAFFNPTPETNHLNLSFQSGFAIKIAAGKVTCNKPLNPSYTALLVVCFFATLAQNNQLRSSGLAGRYV